MKRQLGTGLWRWAALLALLAGSNPAFATRDDHLAWVSPDQFVATPGAVLSLGYTRGATFGTRGALLTAADLELVQVDLGGSLAPAVAFVRPGAEPRTLVTLMKPGYAAVDVILRAQRRTLPSQEVPGYLRNLHASDELRTLWDQQPAGSDWVETRRFCLKTALKVGQPAQNDENWGRNGGRPWEIVAAQNPLELRKGASFRIQLLEHGAPVSGMAVDFVSAGEVVQHVVMTDERGFASAPLGQAGLWLIHAVDIKRVEGDKLEWVVDFAGFTVSVGP